MRMLTLWSHLLRTAISNDDILDTVFYSYVDRTMASIFLDQ